MSVEQAAAVLQVSRDTLVRFTDDRYTPAGQQLRASKTNGVWQIRRSDLAAFVNAHSVTPDGERPITVSATELTRTYSLDEVAANTGLSLSWLRTSTRAKRIPHIRAGKAPRMTEAQVDRAIEIASVNAQEDDELQADRVAYASGRRGPRRQAA
jgi:hypothetical protein